MRPVPVRGGQNAHGTTANAGHTRNFGKISQAINIQSLRDNAPAYSPYSDSTATTITPSTLIRKVIVG